jgi:hypothetical protein
MCIILVTTLIRRTQLCQSHISDSADAWAQLLSAPPQTLTSQSSISPLSTCYESPEHETHS